MNVNSTIPSSKSFALVAAARVDESVIPRIIMAVKSSSHHTTTSYIDGLKSDKIKVRSYRA